MCRWGLYVSFGKTYTQERPAGNEELQYTNESLFSVDGNKIGNVTKFKALGQKFDSTNLEGYIWYRIGQATGQFKQKRHIFTHHKNVNKRVRVDFAKLCSKLVLSISYYVSKLVLSSSWYRFLRQMTPGDSARKPIEDGEE